MRFLVGVWFLELARFPLRKYFYKLHYVTFDKGPEVWSYSDLVTTWLVAMVTCFTSIRLPHPDRRRAAGFHEGGTGAASPNRSSTHSFPIIVVSCSSPSPLLVCLRCVWS